MKNDFAREYAQEQLNIRNYHEAEDRNDEAGMQAARDAHKAWSEAIDAKGQDYANLYHLYEDAQDGGNELIDISEVVWDEKVEALIASFRKYGIERFTFSSGWSSAVETAWLFIQQGCKLEGLIEINGRCKAFMSNDYEKKHGYLFSVCDDASHS